MTARNHFAFRFFSKNCKIFRSEFCKKCWRTFKPNNKVVGSRPFYRDDIFYEGSIQGLPDYRRRITLPLPKSIRNVVGYSKIRRFMF